MAVDKFQLTVEASTRGEQDLARMEAAVNRFSAAAEKSSAKTKALGADMSGAGSKIKAAFADPMGAAGDAAQGLLTKLGPMGVMLGVTATGAVAAGTAVFSLAKAFGNLYEQQANNALRLGVAINDYALLAQESTNAGLAADSLVLTMRGLSKALADNSDEGKKAKDALMRLGVSGQDAFGAVRPMRDLLLEIADKMGDIRGPAERAEIALKIFGRSGLEVLPLMNSKLRDHLTELQKAGVGWSDMAAAQGKATDEMMDRFNTKWAVMMKSIKQFGAERFLELTDADDPFESARKRYEARRLKEYRERQAGDAREIGLVGGRLVGRRFGPGGSMDPTRVTDEGLTATLKRAAVAAKQFAEEAAKAAKEAEKLNTFVARGLKDPARLAPSLYGPGERPAFGGALGTFGTRQEPSLLGGGEPANRGFMGLDPAAIQRGVDAAHDTLNYQIQKLQLLTGPGGEIAAVETITAMKLRAIDLSQTQFEIEKKRLEITRDGELQILAIQKQRAAELRAAGASIFDAITAGGGGIKKYAAGMGLGMGRTIFSNVYSQIAGGMSGKLSMTKDPNSMLGKILQGTPFGADPNAQAGAVQMTAAQIQMQAAQTQLSAAGMGGTGLGSIMGMMGGGTSALPANVAMLNPFYGGGGMSTRAKWGMGLGAGVGAGLGVYSGIKQGGAAGALTSTAALAGGLAAILPMLGPALAMAGPIGGAIAIGATLAMAFIPDPKEARRRAMEEQAKQRIYDEASGVEYNADVYGRSTDYGRRGDVRVYLNVNALDSQSIIDRQEDIGEAVRQALSSYPPLAMDIKGAALGA